MNDGYTIHVAAGQTFAYPLVRAKESLQTILDAIDQAGCATPKPDLLVLPECAYPAYLIGDAENFRQTDTLDNGQLEAMLSAKAKQYQMHIVCGFVEDDGQVLRNAAMLLDPDGKRIGTYRKNFLWGADNDVFEPGEDLPVFDTRIGKIGMVICADSRAPENIARLVIDGAQLIAVPTCWINVANSPDRYENPQAEFLISARAKEFGVPFVCANKFGWESDRLGYCGRSLVVDGEGTVVNEGPGNQAALVVGEVSLRDLDQVHYHDELWESLTQWDEPVVNETPAIDEITIALWPAKMLTHEDLEQLANQDVRVIFTCSMPDDLPQLDYRLEIMLPEHAGKVWPTLAGHVGCLMGSEIEHFSRSRLMALAGAHLLVVFDCPDDLKTLRTRAVENRIFVLGLSRNLALAIAPDGEVIGYSNDPDDDGLIVTITPSDANNKYVFPGTDIWQQRRTTVYRHGKS